MAVPPVLLDPAFAPLWARAADRLDRFGLDWRGDLPLPPDLPSTVYARLGEVLDRRFPTTKRRLDLAAFERRLEQRYGTDLPSLLAAAGHPPIGRREARVAALAQRDATGAALAEAARDELGDEPWVGSWTVAVRSGIADPEQARWAALAVARVLGASGGQRSRGEVAARALGSAHLLDRGTPERRWVRAALSHRAGAPDRDDADLWADAGLPGDVVSAPVLTWALPLLGDGVAAAVRTLTAAGSPAPLTTLTLRDLFVAVPPGTIVLSVENPRLLEAAAARRLEAPVLCTAGEPTTAVNLLISALRAAGAVVRHHGDLDPAGLAIAGRLADRGVVPWRMTADDYRAAVAAAAAAGVELPVVDPTRIPDTPWDPALAAALHHHRVAVEEERVLDELLDDHGRPPARSGVEQRPYWRRPGAVEGKHVSVAPGDEAVPNIARIYDYLLGGSHNLAVDRERAEQLIAARPTILATARANRLFLRHAVEHALDLGIRQFLDLGAGIPTAGAVHEIAWARDPAARVAYVENEPVAVAQSRALLAGVDGATITGLDLRDVDAVLGAEGIAGLLDPAHPVAVLSLATLHFLPDADQPARVLARYRAAFAPGSVLAITHSSDDFPDHPVFAEASREVARLAESTSHPLTLRSRTQIEAMVRAAGFVPDADGLREVRCWASPPQEEPLGGYAVISEPVA